MVAVHIPRNFKMDQSCSKKEFEKADWSVNFEWSVLNRMVNFEWSVLNRVVKVGRSVLNRLVSFEFLDLRAAMSFSLRQTLSCQNFFYKKNSGDASWLYRLRLMWSIDAQTRIRNSFPYGRGCWTLRIWFFA